MRRICQRTYKWSDGSNWKYLGSSWAPFDSSELPLSQSCDLLGIQAYSTRINDVSQKGNLKKYEAKLLHLYLKTMWLDTLQVYIYVHQMLGQSRKKYDYVVQIGSS